MNKLIICTILILIILGILYKKIKEKFQITPPLTNKNVDYVDDGSCQQIQFIINNIPTDYTIIKIHYTYTSDISNKINIININNNKDNPHFYFTRSGDNIVIDVPIIIKKLIDFDYNSTKIELIENKLYKFIIYVLSETNEQIFITEIFEKDTNINCNL